MYALNNKPKTTKIDRLMKLALILNVLLSCYSVANCMDQQNAAKEKDTPRYTIVCAKSDASPFAGQLVALSCYNTETALIERENEICGLLAPGELQVHAGEEGSRGYVFRKIRGEGFEDYRIVLCNNRIDHLFIGAWRNYALRLLSPAEKAIILAEIQQKRNGKIINPFSTLVKQLVQGDTISTVQPGSLHHLLDIPGHFFKEIL